MSQEKSKVVGAEIAAQVMGEMKEELRFDLGHSFVVRGHHPIYGNIVVINSAEGSSAIISV